MRGLYTVHCSRIERRTKLNYMKGDNAGQKSLHLLGKVVSVPDTCEHRYETNRLPDKSDQVLAQHEEPSSHEVRIRHMERRVPVSNEQIRA